jgi:hypothetical protein
MLTGTCLQLFETVSVLQTLWSVYYNRHGQSEARGLNAARQRFFFSARVTNFVKAQLSL